MKANFEEIIDRSKSNICPHLALKGDIESYAAFPSVMNACHRGHFSITPKISHQNTFCLSPNFISCPIFQNNQTNKFPRDLQYKYFGIPRRIKKILTIGLFGILIFSLVLLIIFWEEIETKFYWITPTNEGPISLASGETFQENLHTDIPKNEELFDTEITPDFTEVLSTAFPPTPAITKSDPVLTLDTPIGGVHQFIIHRAQEGESLQYLADLHKTSSEAILAVNEDLITPLWVDWVVVVPVNTEDVGKFPKFTAFQIKEEGITLGKLADKLEVPLEEMSLYNNIDPDHILHEGEWILIPRN